MPVEVQIDRFVGHWREVSGRIAQLTGDRERNVLVKTLYAAMLDALAKCIYPSAKKPNRDRFVSFVRHFGTWAECNRISLPHLLAALSRVPDPNFSEVRAYAKSAVVQWQMGSKPTPARDPAYNEVKSRWPLKPDEMFLEGVSLDSLQHVHLLYAYRNSLVHELREPGYPGELNSDPEPFYLSSHTFDPAQPGNIDAADHAWELVYPLKFFADLCGRSIDGLEKHLTQEKLDPYASYRFGTYWLTALN